LLFKKSCYLRVFVIIVTIFFNDCYTTFFVISGKQDKMRSSVLFLSIFLVVARASVLSYSNIDIIVEGEGVKESRQPFISKVSTDFPPMDHMWDGTFSHTFSNNPRISGLYSGDFAFHGYRDNRILHSGSFDVKISNPNVFKMNTFGFHAKGVQQPIYIEFLLNGESVGQITDFPLHQALPKDRKFFPRDSSASGYIHFVLTKGRFDQVRIRSVQPFDSDSHVFGFLEVGGDKLVKHTEGSIVSVEPAATFVPTSYYHQFRFLPTNKESKHLEMKAINSSLLASFEGEFDVAPCVNREQEGLNCLSPKGGFEFRLLNWLLKFGTFGFCFDRLPGALDIEFRLYGKQVVAVESLIVKQNDSCVKITSGKQFDTVVVLPTSSLIPSLSFHNFFVEDITRSRTIETVVEEPGALETTLRYNNKLDDNIVYKTEISKPTKDVGDVVKTKIAVNMLAEDKDSTPPNAVGLLLEEVRCPIQIVFSQDDRLVSSATFDFTDVLSTATGHAVYVNFILTSGEPFNRIEITHDYNKHPVLFHNPVIGKVERKTEIEKDVTEQTLQTGVVLNRHGWLTKVVEETVETKKDEPVQTKEEPSPVEAVQTKKDEAVQTKEDESVQTKEEPAAVEAVSTKKDEAVPTKEDEAESHQPSGLFQLEKKQVQGKPSVVAVAKSGSAKYSIATGMIAVLLCFFL
jgi:uncharacterized protein YdaU (DUF1376 family)